jgi:hypothetical protein
LHLVSTGGGPTPGAAARALDRRALADLAAPVVAGGSRMKWVTRARPKVDRVACPWLIRKWIDADAEFLFVPPEQVLAVAEREGAISFDAPSARFDHRDGRCTFEVLLSHYALDDPALVALAAIVHGADVTGEEDYTPQSHGLKAIAEGFQLTHADDHEILVREFAVYDALYTWCRSQTS